jgi:hypothetical protein
MARLARRLESNTVGKEDLDDTVEEAINARLPFLVAVGL